jgi:hypothetical protein
MADLNDILQDVLSDVNDWLRFAEAKNGVLLALNSGCVIGVSKLIVDIDHVFWTFYLGLCVALFLASAAVCLFSFLPVTQMPMVVRSCEKDPAENVLFFGSIVGHDMDSYLEAIAGPSSLSVNPSSKLERHYAEQIIINSKIAAAKFRFFRRALWLSIAAVISVPGALILYFTYPMVKVS